MMISDRLKSLPPYLFVEIDRKKKEAAAKGVDIISLGIGDPDLPTPDHIVRFAQEALKNPLHHQYPLGSGLPKFREAVADWYVRRFRVGLDPKTEVCALIGSKEGIGHLPLAFINPGDIVLVPEPGYPVYLAGTVMAGGKVHYLPLKEENGFLPDLDTIPQEVAERAKILFLNYPNNPTAAQAPLSFFEKAVSWAKKYNVLIAHDAAYTEIYFEEPPQSFLAVPGAKDVGIEFHSCSKTYNMTGWRVGWVCGNAQAVSALAKVKDNYDSGGFHALQEAAAKTISGNQDCVVKMRSIYRERRDVLVKELRALGWKVNSPLSTFYVWVHTPAGLSSVETASRLLDEAGVVCTPGNGFGPSGEGYVRFALTVPVERMQEVFKRMRKMKW